MNVKELKDILEGCSDHWEVTISNDYELRGMIWKVKPTFDQDLNRFVVEVI